MMDEKEKLNRHLPGAKFPEDIVKYMWTVDPVEEAQRALHARASGMPASIRNVYSFRRWRCAQPICDTLLKVVRRATRPFPLLFLLLMSSMSSVIMHVVKSSNL